MALIGRLVVRVLSFLVPAALALSGLAAAVFSIQEGRATLSLAHLARLIGLPRLRQTVGSFLASLEQPGPVAIVTLLGGLAVAAIGLGLLIAVLIGSRERQLRIASIAQRGSITARPRALASVVSSVVAGSVGVKQARASVAGSRAGRHVVRVRATRSTAVPAAEVRDNIDRALAPLVEAFDLQPRIHVASPESEPGRNRT